MKNFRWGHLHPFLYLGLGVFLGFLFCNYTFFEFDTKINLVELINVLITASVALFLAMFIQDKQSKDQKEKEFIINEINELLLFVKEIKEYSKNNRYPFEEIKSTFKDFNVQHRFVSEVISTHTAEEVKVVASCIRSLRTTITRESPIGGVISLNSVSKRNSVDKKLYSLKLGIFNLLKAVNKKH